MRVGTAALVECGNRKEVSDMRYRRGRRGMRRRGRRRYAMAGRRRRRTVRPMRVGFRLS